MKTKQHIPAFTLSEMIVVIILTSMVVGLAFSVLSMVQKHMSTIQENLTKNTELNKLEQVLWMDFNRYGNIYYHSNKQQLIFTSALKSTTYTFHTDYLTRELDTIDIATKELTFFFDGNKVPNGTIDAIKLATDKNFQNQLIFVFKHNDATQFMK